MLKSKLLSANDRLKRCEVQDSSHVKTGDQGDFVRLIQQALGAIDGLSIAKGETTTGLYGRSTAAAVLSYKKKRRIINQSYQSSPDDIVGKMTIKSLDDEMLALESQPRQPFFGSVVRNAFGRVV